MDIEKFTIELEIGWFGGRSNIARMHEKGSVNLPARKHLTKLLVAQSLENISTIVI